MKPRKHGSFHPKHSLGQNFIEDEALLERLADASLVGKEDCVLEIGPGFGALTRPLARRARQVLSIEIDRSLIPILRVTLEAYQNVQILCADVMKTDLPALVRDRFGEGASVRVAANLPYYITTDVLTRLLLDLPQAQSIAVMVQKEVGDKLLSEPGEEGYGPLCVMCRYLCQVERALDVPAACFNPPPHVDSSFMVLTRRGCPPFEVADEALLFRLIRGVFQMRRKTAANNLIASMGLTRGQAEGCLSDCGIDLQARAQTLSLRDLCMLSNRIAQIHDACREQEGI